MGVSVPQEYGIPQLSPAEQAAQQLEAEVISFRGRSVGKEPVSAGAHGLILRRTGRHLAVGSLVSAALRVSVFRTLYYSVRHRGWCIVLRGTRLKLSRGSQIHIARGSRLVLGTRHVAATPCSVHLRRNARLSVRGTVEIVRGTRILISDGAHLEIGPETYINYDSTLSCFDHITIGCEMCHRLEYQYPRRQYSRSHSRRGAASLVKAGSYRRQCLDRHWCHDPLRSDNR